MREGIAFCLSLPLDCPRVQLNPRRFPPQQSFSMRGDDPVMNYPYGRVIPGMKEVVCDDRVTLSPCNIPRNGMRCATWAMNMMRAAARRK